MAAIIYLSSGEQMPDSWDDEPWLIVEASDNGRIDRADFDRMLGFLAALVGRLDDATVRHLRDFTPAP